jgi:Peptidase M50B-like
MKSRETPSKQQGGERPTARYALIGASVISLLLSWFVPFGRTLLYPFTLLGTWVHEMGHGLTALAVGGKFDSLDVFGDASGLAHVNYQPGHQSALVSLGGLLAPPVVGALILTLARGPRRARFILGGLALALLVSLVIWVRSFAGFFVVPLVGGGLVIFTRWGSDRERLWLAQFIGVRLAVDTISRSDYLFVGNCEVAGQSHRSDIGTVADAWGAHYLMWGTLVAALSFALVALGLFMAWRQPKARAKANGKPAARGAGTVDVEAKE